jgi:hypothetical protein
MFEDFDLDKFALVAQLKFPSKTIFCNFNEFPEP